MTAILEWATPENVARLAEACDVAAALSHGLLEGAAIQSAAFIEVADSVNPDSIFQSDEMVAQLVNRVAYRERADKGYALQLIGTMGKRSDMTPSLSGVNLATLSDANACELAGKLTTSWKIVRKQLTDKDGNLRFDADKNPVMGNVKVSEFDPANPADCEKAHAILWAHTTINVAGAGTKGCTSNLNPNLESDGLKAVSKFYELRGNLRNARADFRRIKREAEAAIKLADADRIARKADKKRASKKLASDAKSAVTAFNKAKKAVEAIEKKMAEVPRIHDSFSKSYIRRNNVPLATLAIPEWLAKEINRRPNGAPLGVNLGYTFAAEPEFKGKHKPKNSVNARVSGFGESGYTLAACHESSREAIDVIQNQAIRTVLFADKLAETMWGVFHNDGAEKWSSQRLADALNADATTLAIYNAGRAFEEDSAKEFARKWARLMRTSADEIVSYRTTSRGIVDIKPTKPTGEIIRYFVRSDKQRAELAKMKRQSLYFKHGQALWDAENYANSVVSISARQAALKWIAYAIDGTEMPEHHQATYGIAKAVGVQLPSADWYEAAGMFWEPVYRPMTWGKYPGAFWTDSGFVKGKQLPYEVSDYRYVTVETTDDKGMSRSFVKREFI